MTSEVANLIARLDGPNVLSLLNRHSLYIIIAFQVTISVLPILGHILETLTCGINVQDDGQRPERCQNNSGSN
jgi:hypothetical protein